LQKTTDCIFIFTPGPESRGNCFDYHLGSAYIIACLKANGFHAQQYIRNDPARLEVCTREIINFNPKIAGFTVYDSNYNISVLIADQIKKLSPRTIIVFGGPCSSVHHDFIMNTCSFVDGCFINEGEETFLEFITRLSAANFRYEETDLSSIAGLSYRQSNRIFRNPENRIWRNHSDSRNFLDNFPSPYLSGVIPPEEGHNAGILTARGCNQNCVYCNCAVLSNRKISTHSVERVISELDFISHFLKGNQILTFQDDTFTLIPNRAAEICKVITDHRIKVRLSCITRCDCVDESLLDKMKEAGFVSLTFSLESAIPKILRKIGKVHVAEDFPSDSMEKEIRFIESFNRVAAYAKKIGINSIITSVMVGLPGESLSEANQTIEAVDRNSNIDHYSHNFLKIFKGTPLSIDYEKYGYKLRYLNNNPVFVRMTYPEDFVRKVFISPKSHLHSLKKDNDKSSLNILSLIPQNKGVPGFSNIILQADHVQGEFVKWLKEILDINGTIIQLYSGEKAINSLSDSNYEKFIKYSSPSLNIRNYYLEESGDARLLLSSESVLLKSYSESENIKICGIGQIRSGLENPAVKFMKTLAREENHKDSVAAHSLLCEVGRAKNPFLFLTGKKALPYFANMCKWTRNLANCVARKTLIINEKNEVRFCWYGSVTGSVGQSYKEIISCLDSEIQKTKNRRDCARCKEESNCIKCPFPFPLPEAEYCEDKKTTDTIRAAELIIGLDQIKQIFY
jgi:anaerobic magnesium-protoporphyrin IX monomethyl ester cyclase